MNGGAGLRACAVCPCPDSLGSCPSSLGISFSICDRDGLGPGTHQDLILPRLSVAYRVFVGNTFWSMFASCCGLQHHTCVPEKFHWLVWSLLLWLLCASSPRFLTPALWPLSVPWGNSSYPIWFMCFPANLGTLSSGLELSPAKNPATWVWRGYTSKEQEPGHLVG